MSQADEQPVSNIHEEDDDNLFDDNESVHSNINVAPYTGGEVSDLGSSGNDANRGNSGHAGGNSDTAQPQLPALFHATQETQNMLLNQIDACLTATMPFTVTDNLLDDLDSSFLVQAIQQMVSASGNIGLLPFRISAILHRINIVILHLVEGAGGNRPPGLNKNRRCDAQMLQAVLRATRDFVTSGFTPSTHLALTIWTPDSCRGLTFEHCDNPPPGSQPSRAAIIALRNAAARRLNMTALHQCTAFIFHPLGQPQTLYLDDVHHHMINLNNILTSSGVVGEVLQDSSFLLRAIEFLRQRQTCFFEVRLAVDTVNRIQVLLMVISLFCMDFLPTTPPVARMRVSDCFSALLDPSYYFDNGIYHKILWSKWGGELVLVPVSKERELEVRMRLRRCGGCPPDGSTLSLLSEPLDESENIGMSLNDQEQTDAFLQTHFGAPAESEFILVEQVLKVPNRSMFVASGSALDLISATGGAATHVVSLSSGAAIYLHICTRNI
ncbi:hypothetical protein K461DRAFT_319000 [Myriangium duriaei CBS 260.36]|uniref:Uncharacterized protein n=1 Tax=Myriangium duriaei CBS 260.36 TaxID=1168546 RepID=A0A9P4J7R6_9PEZI|nr:hypothetical protein K461DRAFT_319000 [Myriangium duriaei CBS 260.36]